MLIQGFSAKKILNSRKDPTISIQIKTTEGVFEASAPEGASKGENEVMPFSKKGINDSVEFANSLGKKLIDNKIEFNSFKDLEIIDNLFHKIDKTKQLELTGGNTLFAIQASLLKALAASYKKEVWRFLYDEDNKSALKQAERNKSALILSKAHKTQKDIATYRLKFPRPLGNCIGGGKHTREIEKPDFQEFLILPDAKSKKPSDNHKISLKAYKEIKKLIIQKDKLFVNKVTDEFAFISYLDNETLIRLVSEAKSRIEKQSKEHIDIGIDVAASSFYDKKTRTYHYVRFNGKPRILKTKEQIDYIFELCKRYNLAYIEDPLDEEDFSGFSILLKKIKKTGLKTLICGDDLICTNHERLKKAIKSKSINATIVKPNQCGSLIETKKVIDLAKSHKIAPVMSHRSGETTDPILAELALGWQVPIIKISVIGIDMHKTNDLIRIEKKLI